MKLGLFLNTQDPVGNDPRAMFENLLTQTRIAREAGFEVILAGQHYVTDVLQFQPFPLLGRIAAEAGPMRIATGVIILPLHHPIAVAENIATIDSMTDSRPIAGVAAGYREEEFSNFGVPKDERAGRMAEGVEILRQLWTETNVTFEGEYYSISDVTINPRPAQPPSIWYGANSKPAIGRAARDGDAWYINPHSTIEEIKEHKQAYDRIRETRDKDTNVPIRREMFVAPTTDEAIAVSEEFLTNKYQRYVKWGQHREMADPQELLQSFEQLRKDRFVLGSPQEVCEQLKRYESELGVEYVIARVHWPGMAYERSQECLELIGDEVIPNL